MQGPPRGGRQTSWLGALPCTLIFLASMPSARADLYSFESLTVNNLIHNQEGWFDQAGQGQAVISLDETDNGTKLVRHLPTVNSNQSAFLTRLNDESFSLPPRRLSSRPSNSTSSPHTWRVMRSIFR